LLQHCRISTNDELSELLLAELGTGVSAWCSVSILTA
jgi:hypothetical protein